MANKKNLANSAAITQRMNPPDPKKLDECLFFKRLGFEMSDEQKKFRDAIYDPNIRMIACNAKAGSGKAQPKDTVIPTPEGEKRLGDLKVGDFVFGRDGKPTKVLGVFDQGFLEAYRIVLSDGRSTICNGEHLWTHYSNTTSFLITETLSSMLQRKIYLGNGRGTRYSLPTNDGVEYREKELPIDPYVIGIFLGDGCCTGRDLTLSSGDEEIVKSVTKLCNFSGYKKVSNKNYSWYFYDSNNSIIKTRDFFKDFPELIGYCGEKKIPDVYLYASKEQRLSLLQGLLDTDGGITYANGRYNIRFTTTGTDLKNNIVTLARSLGYIVSVLTDKRVHKYPNTGVCYNLFFRVPNKEKANLFRLTRKKERALEARKSDKRIKHDRVSIISVDKLEEKYDMRCIYVDNPEHLYLTNDFIVTHNTTIAAATACLMVEYGLYDEIFYCFSTNNGARESLGFLPGSAEEKEASFYEPCLQALAACGYQPEKVVKELNPEGEKSGMAFVSCRSHAFLRGTNIDDRTILILDETQNCYWDEIKKILTRVKDGAKVIMIGHVGQIDIQKHPENSGFKAYINLFKDDPLTMVCQLTKNFRGHISELADTMTAETFKKYREMELPFLEDK